MIKSSHSLSDALRNALSGDLEAFEMLLSTPNVELSKTVENLPEEQLILTKKAVRKILSSLQSGLISPEQAQSWASFVRRGYVPEKGNARIRPINIHYEDEDDLAGVVGRLDELGDRVDGKIDNAELTELLQTVQ